MQGALRQQWVNADAGMKKQVKQHLLATLGTQVCGSCVRWAASVPSLGKLPPRRCHRRFGSVGPAGANRLRPWPATIPPPAPSSPALSYHSISNPQGDAGHTAALVIAKVAAVEVPMNDWPELIPALLSNMGASPSTRELRQSTLETLGYTCEELGNLEDDYLSQQEVNAILTAVVQVRRGAGGRWCRLLHCCCLVCAVGDSGNWRIGGGGKGATLRLSGTAPTRAPTTATACCAPPQGMRKEEPEAEVRHAATVALQNALTFAHNNFSNDSERNYIMQIICEGTLAGGWAGGSSCRIAVWWGPDCSTPLTPASTTSPRTTNLQKARASGRPAGSAWPASPAATTTSCPPTCRHAEGWRGGVWLRWERQ